MLKFANDIFLPKYDQKCHIYGLIWGGFEMLVIAKFGGSLLLDRIYRIVRIF